MKTRFFLICFLFGLQQVICAQDKPVYPIPLIGSDAPSFTAHSTQGIISFPGDYLNKWKILVSHPRDFTPVCSSELLEMAQKQDEFEKLGVKLFVLSTDTLYQHQTWAKTLDTLKYKGRTPVAIDFPLIDDNGKSISRMYGMLHPTISTTENVRGVFIVDPKDKIRAIFFYPMEIGRNLDEIQRTVIALQTSDKEHVLTPANWNPGEDVLLPFTDRKSAKDESVYYIAPFMIGKKRP
jgi:peroxiredoxin (alkyl hydroperoxide reductase subunit C)